MLTKSPLGTTSSFETDLFVQCANNLRVQFELCAGDQAEP